MDLDPHSLQQIIRKIEQQMRCPQCGKHLPVDFTSVRLTGENFLLLQLKCETCDAFIVLHAMLQGAEIFLQNADPTLNASSALRLSDQELTTLREALTQSGGSFDQLFRKYGGKDGGASAAETRIV